MPDPSRLQIVRDEIERVLGAEAAHDPRLIAAMLAAASSDFAAVTVAAALREIAAALVVEDGPENGGIVPARELFRVRP
jgi:hypothetical protein